MDVISQDGWAEKLVRASKKGLCRGPKRWMVAPVLTNSDDLGSVRPAHLSVIVALPSVHERARFLEEPFLARAPITPFEWLIAGRRCQLLPSLVAKTDQIVLCCHLPDCHDANPLSGER